MVSLHSDPTVTKTRSLWPLQWWLAQLVTFPPASTTVRSHWVPWVGREAWPHTRTLSLFHPSNSSHVQAHKKPLLLDRDTAKFFSRVQFFGPGLSKG